MDRVGIHLMRLYFICWLSCTILRFTIDYRVLKVVQETRRNFLGGGREPCLMITNTKTEVIQRNKTILQSDYVILYYNEAFSSPASTTLATLTHSWTQVVLTVEIVWEGMIAVIWSREIHDSVRWNCSSWEEQSKNGMWIFWFPV